MHEQGRRWLLDAHQRLTVDRIPINIGEINKGTINPNVYYGSQKKIVGEVINARNIENKICVEILWYGNSFEQFEYKATDCFIGAFKILGEYIEPKKSV